MRLFYAINTFIAMLLGLSSFSQSSEVYNALTVPEALQKKANAVVRYDHKHIIINDYNDMTLIKKRIVTVYNENGNSHAKTWEYYNEDTKIKKIETRVFDKFGIEIKKIKKNDFTDESAVSGGTIYSDDRVKSYTYKPINYPYTIEFVSETHYKSTSYIPIWMPLDDYFLGVEYSELKIENNLNENLRLKEEKFEPFNITSSSKSSFKAENLEPLNYEAYSPSISFLVPKLSIALDKFIINGVEGRNGDWKSQGEWMYLNLLKEKSDLPEDTKKRVQNLVKDIKDPIEKAKIIYKYVQSNTRYISIQEGIGGMQPIAATEVDNVKYGDCKGLSNYTKALLESVGVESYYTRLFASKSPQNVDKNFVSFQGQTNHVILAIPNNDDYIWLECTSQTNPFGFIAGFTDDRDVLVIKPEGGEIVHTKIYNAEDSIQNTKAVVTLNDNGGLDGNVNITTTGFQYSLHEGVENETESDKKLHYKNYWDNINNLSIADINITNDKENIIYKEAIKLSTTNYASKSGDRLIFEPNMFNKVTNIPPRYNVREQEFKIDRAFKDVDEFVIKLPEGFKIEAITEDSSLKTKFGSYSFKIEALEDNTLKYSRTYILLKGNYKKEDYQAFRAFRKNIVKHDKTKIALIKA